MYSNTGKQVLHTDRATGKVTHIADAMDNEAAHAIATGMNERSPNFIRDALVTCSPDFHGEMVDLAQFKGRINGAIDALNKLDQVKKSLFYGRDNNLVSLGRQNCNLVLDGFGGPDSAVARPVAINVLHAILGIATEAGELLEALRNGYNGNGFDWVNIQEEAGDVAWYEALLADSGDYTFEEVQQRIIRKLKTRFADKFSAAEANERNLDAERAVLEDRTDNVIADEGRTVIDSNSTSETRSPEGSGLTDSQLRGLEQADEYPIDRTAASVPGLKPSTPASGKEAVNLAEAEANQAFANVGNVSPKVEPEIPTSDELAKSPAERLHPLPGEATAQRNAGN